MFDPMTAEDRIEIVPFSKKFDRSEFDCGHANLDLWLKEFAGQNERSNNTRTFLAVNVESGKVVGYHSSCAFQISLDEASLMLGTAKAKYPMPAILLARLAVDKRNGKQGLGRRLLAHAIENAAQASRLVGVEVLVVDAIDSEASTFYRKCGFQQFADHPMKLFMRVADILKTVGS